MTTNDYRVGKAIAVLDSWLDTMRGPGGYGGPVVHWWQDSISFTGAGLDWRYEGIITGYLELYIKTSDSIWLEKARLAGEDLLSGQLKTGNFQNSSFELNPMSGGMPHEVSCDLALLNLAKVLKDMGNPGWQIYLEAAEKNIFSFIIGKLWDEELQILRNTAWDSSFVPNKSATMVEALIALLELNCEKNVLEKYMKGSLESILAAQVTGKYNPMKGAICQAVSNGKKNERYFPFYICRCIRALIKGYYFFVDKRYLYAAEQAMLFVLSTQYPDGSFPQVIYGGGQVNRYPQWIAGTGDILSAMRLMNQEGVEINSQPTMDWLMSGLMSTGCIRTAFGFASQFAQNDPSSLPDFRDLIPVCGWVDKAFHFLCGQVKTGINRKSVDLQPVETPCLYRGSEAVYYEDDQLVECVHKGRVLYRWQKGATWAEVCQI